MPLLCCHFLDSRWPCWVWFRGRVRSMVGGFAWRFILLWRRLSCVSRGRFPWTNLHPWTSAAPVWGLIRHFFLSRLDSCYRLWGWQWRCFRGRRFRIRRGFRDWRRGIPFCSNIKQYKRLQLRICGFREGVFCRFRWLIRSVRGGSGWRLRLVGLRLLNRGVGGIAWGTFRRFSCVPGGRVVWFVGGFRFWLFGLIFWRRRTYRVRSSSRL